MKCPKCKSENTKVLEKRNIEEETSIRRRRECASCDFRFTTYERVDQPSIIVLKKNGQKEPFSREKVLKGILRAIEKRPVNMVQVDNILTSLEEKLKARGLCEVESSVIGGFIIEKLKEIDVVSYIRFASVFKAFKNINSFEKELEELKKG
jgi:transcriptional repressor NrdR